MTDERDRISSELRRIRDEVRRKALLPEEVLPEPRTPAPKTEIPREEPREEEEAPKRPDATAVNALYRAEPASPPGGLRGFFARLLARILREGGEAQKAWNARQVELDNEILGYIDARFDRTHAHYDRILGIYGRHLGEADERHMILQEELVAHVHDLVKRIDLVLAEGERGRLSSEFALREVRERLVVLEERLLRG
jgi:hypothetical protein